MLRLLLHLLLFAGLASAQTLAVVTRENLIEANRNFSTTLSAGIDNSTLTIPVTSATAITISTPGAIVIAVGTSPNVEYIKICSKSGNTLTACAAGRAFAGTTALSHSNAATVVGGMLTPESYNAIVAALAQTTAALGTNLAGVVVFQATAPATCTASQLPLWFDSDATGGQNLHGCTATNTWTLLSGGGSGGSGGDWVKYTIGHAALTTSSLTEDETLGTCAQLCKIEAVTIKHSTAFSGGGISEMTVSVGTAADGEFYASAFDVFQAASDTDFQDTNLFRSATMAAAGHSVIARFTSVGANVVAATAGSVDIWVRVTTLP